jgi:hypothetical protein
MPKVLCYCIVFLVKQHLILTTFSIRAGIFPRSRIVRPVNREWSWQHCLIRTKLGRSCRPQRYRFKYLHLHIVTIQWSALASCTVYFIQVTMFIEWIYSKAVDLHDISVFFHIIYQLKLSGDVIQYNVFPTFVKHISLFWYYFLFIMTTSYFKLYLKLVDKS